MRNSFLTIYVIAPHASKLQLTAHLGLHVLNYVGNYTKQLFLLVRDTLALICLPQTPLTNLSSSGAHWVKRVTNTTLVYGFWAGGEACADFDTPRSYESVNKQNDSE